jgi:hypothetical protein
LRNVASPLAVPPRLAIEIGEVDRRRRKLRAQPQRRFIFRLRLRREAAAGIEAAQRRARLGPIGVEPLRSDELGRRTLEALPVGHRLVRGRDAGEQRNGADAHAANGVGQQRRGERPSAN